MSGIREGLALCGGGGRGAYQIGVLRAMCEKNILDRFDSIAGTSVGALNAILFGIGDLELAERIWLEYISPNTMLFNFDLDENNKLKVSRDLIKLILKEVDVSRIKDCGKKIYVNTINVTQMKTEHFYLNDKSSNEIIDLLLASSAIPGIYPAVYIGGQKHVDGGFFNALGNMPIEVLAENGYKNISIVALESYFDPRSLRNHGINIYSKFPNVKFDIIKPSISNGAILDFSEQSIKSRMNVGYLDTIAKYSTGSNNMAAYTVNDVKKYARKIIETAEDFEKFVTVEKFKMLNAKLPVIDAGIFYDDIYTVDKWKIQQHSGVFPFHYRIIDPKGERRAWTLDTNELVILLMDFEMRFKSKNIRNNSGAKIVKIHRIKK